MEDLTIPDLISVTAPEDISSEGIQQASVIKKAASFHSELKAFGSAQNRLMELGLKFGGRVLLVGPAGTDFSSFPDALCTEIPLKRIHLRTTKSTSEERLLLGVRTVFELAQRERPVLIFIEQVDRLFTVSSDLGTTFADLLSESTWDDNEIITVASTSQPGLIDTAKMVVFDRTFVFGNPTREDRTRILSEALAGVEGVDIPTVIDMTDGWGYSDLKQLASALIIKTESGPITLKDVIELLQDGGIVPVGGVSGAAEINSRVASMKTVMGQVDAIYPSDFLDQLYLMMVSEDYPRAQKVIETLNAGLPLSPEATEFLVRFPFVLAGQPEERLARLISAKKSHDRLLRIMGRGG